MAWLCTCSVFEEEFLLNFSNHVSAWDKISARIFSWILIFLNFNMWLYCENFLNYLLKKISDKKLEFISQKTVLKLNSKN
jgi:hypothetical protein